MTRAVGVGSPRVARTSNPWRCIRYCRKLGLDPVDLGDGGRRVGKQAQRAMLLVLASYANPDGDGGYQSMRQLGQDAGTDERSARRAVRALELAGHLVTLLGGRRGENGRLANRYRILIRPDLEAAQLAEDLAGEWEGAADLLEDGAMPPAGGGSAPPTCPVPGGAPQTPTDPPRFDRPRLALRAAAGPVCPTHPVRRPWCPDCRDERRAGWPGGCDRHRRRRRGCADCAAATARAAPVACPHGQPADAGGRASGDCPRCVAEAGDCPHGSPDLRLADGRPRCPLCRVTIRPDDPGQSPPPADLDVGEEPCPVCGYDDPTLAAGGLCARCAVVVEPPPSATAAAIADGA